MHRETMRAALDAAQEPWDVLVIGGGATGLGCALESVTRGMRTVLVEQCDFASGTSSRSTKLFHGGVRYLRGGHFHMVAQSLRAREHARRQARPLVHDTAFLVPVHTAWERFYYSTGLRIYDLLARDHETPRSRAISTIRSAPCDGPPTRSTASQRARTRMAIGWKISSNAASPTRFEPASATIGSANHSPTTGMCPARNSGSA